MSSKWRIDELSELVAMALAADPYEGQVSGRVRDVPDVRTIRYYTTLGLVDRPVEMQGRTAFYSPRHVQQVVAIKKLQAAGATLTEVQERLAGISDSQLQELANLPEDLFVQFSQREAKQEEEVAKLRKSVPSAVPPAPMADPAAAPAEPEPRTRGRRFWSEAPEVSSALPESPAASQPQPATLWPVAQGVTLVWEGVDAGQLDPEAQQILQAAIADLQRALARTGLLEPGS